MHANINVFVKVCYKSMYNLKVFTQSLKVKPLKEKNYCFLNLVSNIYPILSKLDPFYTMRKFFKNQYQKQACIIHLQIWNTS